MKWIRLKEVNEREFFLNLYAVALIEVKKWKREDVAAINATYNIQLKVYFSLNDDPEYFYIDEKELKALMESMNPT